MKPQPLGDAQPTPLHHQVYVVVRQQILEGAFPLDRPMPPEHELARQFNVSRITIRRAFDRLEAEELVSRHQGRGTFARKAAANQPLRSQIKGIFENMMEMGLKTSVRLVEFAYIKASPAVAEELQVAVGDVVQKAVRVRSHQGTPVSVLTTYVPEGIGRTFDADALSVTPLVSLFEVAGHVVSSADQTISAKLADTLVAPLLEIEAGSALLWVRRNVFDQNERPIEHLHALYRPDIYEYQVKMARVAGESKRLWAPSPIDQG
ncbi:GntR family transcriptional regulator [Acuticoccus mangrovi]|uniref:GntR family transcriptional regulator n=1 Tax=Acuticoccus mangrovi TaxID=2796142 RepID=A0A934MC40_9HYPH|nr:GntR family transcriptional regulator [Acuticoccus mangrovi]MBJ3774852.1 GntR family transcriptional regulator [Acuticoccus mangrovi]